MPNQWIETNQPLVESYLATLAKEVIATSKPIGLLVGDIKRKTKPLNLLLKLE
ncbi:hypothetical protein [uncultured Gammaproteobacteria bacterium]|nr:hypothetical protein [uncultured Gammaproteobacteria bacterium]